MEGQLYKGELDVYIAKHKDLKKASVQLFAKSLSGAARLEIYKCSKAEIPEVVILLDEVYKVVEKRTEHKIKGNGFGCVVATKSCTVTLVSSTQKDHDTWTKIIRKAVFGSYEEQQDILFVKSYTDQFNVRPCDATRAMLGTGGTLKLYVEKGYIMLASGGCRLARIKMEHIRNFGFTHDDFHFETGTRSDFGVFNWKLFTQQGSEVHKAFRLAKHKYKTPNECQQMTGQAEAEKMIEDAPPEDSNYDYIPVNVKDVLSPRATYTKVVPIKDAWKVYGRGDDYHSVTERCNSLQQTEESISSSDQSGNIYINVQDSKNEPVYAQVKKKYVRK